MNVENVSKTLDTLAAAGRSQRIDGAGVRKSSRAGVPDRGASESRASGATGVSFSQRLVDVREEQQRQLSFSKHAEKRLSERGISVDQGLMGDLMDAVDKARQKGARDVAVIGREGIFIVNVPHNVVVTTMSEEDMHNRIFTNIDSAVLM